MAPDGAGTLDKCLRKCHLSKSPSETECLEPKCHLSKNGYGSLRMVMMVMTRRDAVCQGHVMEEMEKIAHARSAIHNRSINLPLGDITKNSKSLLGVSWGAKCPPPPPPGRPDTVRTPPLPSPRAHGMGGLTPAHQGFDLADAYPVTYGRHIPSHMVFGRHIPSGFWSSYPVTYVRHTGILPTKRTAYSDLVDVASKFIEELTVTKSKRATRP